MVEDTAVDRVYSENGRVTGISTRGGQRALCEYFVNCAGFWARDVGFMSQPIVKVYLMIHFFSIVFMEIFRFLFMLVNTIIYIRNQLLV